MKKIKVFVSMEAKEDLREILRYLKHELKNEQAAKNVMADYIQTRKRLALSADSLKETEPDTICGVRKLKRINFTSHDFFLLFCLKDGAAYVTNIFHQSQDYKKAVIVQEPVPRFDKERVVSFMACQPCDKMYNSFNNMEDRHDGTAGIDGFSGDPRAADPGRVRPPRAGGRRFTAGGD